IGCSLQLKTDTTVIQRDKTL
ncbi:hypothetical protein Zm00014a_013103, partial [Zea mays]